MTYPDHACSLRCVTAITALVLIGLPSSLHATPIQWSTTEGGNGHFYEMIKDVLNPIRWTEAKAVAEAQSYQGAQGNLVSITSAAEHDFIMQNLYDGDPTWIGPLFFCAKWRDENLPGRRRYLQATCRLPRGFRPTTITCCATARDWPGS